ncbi:hypothetical protein AB6A40_006024 [Gnathostoma spinigerum]|uniref:Uncharacterized protein n=1 Tax=Gnathostoma spinigerum TaxID=75299 RepID=A0ABD6EIB2_9BILA
MFIDVISRFSKIFAPTNPSSVTHKSLIDGKNSEATSRSQQSADNFAHNRILTRDNTTITLIVIMDNTKITIDSDNQRISGRHCNRTTLIAINASIIEGNKQGEIRS